ncbi:hypothetical protein ACQRIU_004929 [Beauveria bassiana]
MPDPSPSQSAVSESSRIVDAGLTDRTREQKPASSRRSHAKSRTGCKTCKARKIKCDEQRPSCRNCLRRGVDCQFLAESGVCPNFLNQNESALALNMLDLKLMHHFSTSTYATLFSSRTVRHFWRGEAVQSALKYDYVMRAMLAVSALHLAHHSPEKREQYISTALTYHRLASREAMSLMSDVDEEHAGSLFLFSVLTIFFALGGPSQPSDGLLLFGESSFPEWLFLLQGTKSLIEMLGPPGSRGPVEPLLAHARQSPLWKDPRPETGDASDMMDAMAELEMLVCSTVDDSEALRIYKYAIKELRMVAMVFLKESQADITDAFTWIYLVLDDFLPLLKVPTQEAIAIFSYFCVLLKKLDMHWWIRGWGDRLIRRAHDMLDSEHKSWIAWPVEEIGCVLST